MIEVADLEVREKIKTVDAAFTWPHPTDKGMLTSALFVRTDDNRPYLIYCPKTSAAISIDEETYYPDLLWPSTLHARKELRLNQTLTEVGDILFYIIPLERGESKVKRSDIESMFGIKVVD